MEGAQAHSAQHGHPTVPAALSYRTVLARTDPPCAWLANEAGAVLGFPFGLTGPSLKPARLRSFLTVTAKSLDIW